MLYVHVSSTIRRSSSRLYFCTTAPSDDPACILCQFTITPKVEIKSKSEQKTSVFITCHNHLFSTIPRKSILTKKTLYILALSPQIGVITFLDLFIAALMQGAPTLFHRYLLWSYHVKTSHFVFSLYEKWSANKPCLPWSKIWHILDVS